MDIKLKITVCMVFLFFFSPARADYHYASHEGSDEYPYTSWETAADSIQNAIDAGSPGDTIYVGSGEWEDMSINLRQGRALIGMGIDSTIIRWTGNFQHFVYPRNNVHIEGFTLMV